MGNVIEFYSRFQIYDKVKGCKIRILHNMDMIKKFLYTTANVDKSAYIWNTSSSMLNAFMTVFVLMVISRIDPVTDAGVFTIAFAIGNLMLAIGRYGIRQFQVSDLKEKYSFRDYYWSRVITCILMCLVFVFYIGKNYLFGLYSMEKTIVIFLVCIVKTLEAFEDVFHGMLQQHGRLDIAGKALTIRLLGYILAYLIVYLLTESLILASLISLILTAALFFIFNYVILKNFQFDKGECTFVNIIKLLKETFPLFLSTYFVMYISNAPKYAIDTVLSSEAQACFNYIFMPVFVIGLLSQFVYQPIIGKLTLLLYNKNKGGFNKIVYQQVAIIFILSLAAIMGGYLLGIPVLSLLYGVDLGGYRNDLLILLIGGAMLAFINFFQMVVTIARCQNWLIGGYCFAFICFVLFGKVVVEKCGLLGISLFYTLILAILAIAFTFMNRFAVKKCLRS